MSETPNLSGRDILILANALTLILAEGKDTAQLIYLGTLLTEIGSGLLTISAIDAVNNQDTSNAIAAKSSLIGSGTLI